MSNIPHLQIYIFIYIDTTSSNMLDNKCNVPNSTLYACGTKPITIVKYFGHQSYVTDFVHTIVKYNIVK